IRTLNQSNEIEDDRNDLVFEMLRFAEALKPKAIMMENVPGLAKSPRTTKLVSALGNLGYTTHFDVLDAQKYGVPQRRRRMILVAGLKGRIEFAPATAEKRTVASVIRSLPEPGGNGDPLHDMVVKRTMAVLDRFKVIPKNGGSWRNLPKRYQLECHKKTSTLRGFKDIYGRMSWDDVSPTITGGCTNPSKGRYLHPDEDRAITLREAALLQTFTPGYYISLKGGKVAAMRLVGNALPPEFIRRQSLQIMKYLGDSKRSHGSDRA
ncbi:MAG: DNA cytosine methyltransferase, partial [Nitrososphaerota archaeon]|nr:DNA cytosine methyltransferase [Nitrososphaerota archaeon]